MCFCLSINHLCVYFGGYFRNYNIHTFILYLESIIYYFKWNVETLPPYGFLYPPLFMLFSMSIDIYIHWKLHEIIIFFFNCQMYFKGPENSLLYLSRCLPFLLPILQPPSFLLLSFSFFEEFSLVFLLEPIYWLWILQISFSWECLHFTFIIVFSDVSWFFWFFSCWMILDCILDILHIVL